MKEGIGVENAAQYDVSIIIEQEPPKMTRKQVIDLLREINITVPVEHEYDYAGLAEPDKTKEFVRLTNGDWRNAIYVVKEGSRYGDTQYFDLLLAIHESGRPICIPVPLAKRFFRDNNIALAYGLCNMTGRVFERIYGAYYQRRNEGTTDDLPY